METKHTPEPWVLADMYIVESDTTKGTAVVANTRAPTTTPYSECRANAARIVACVNACAGIEDPAVELARLRRVEEAAHVALDYLAWNPDDKSADLAGYIMDAQEVLRAALEA